MKRSLKRLQQGFESSCGSTKEFASFARKFKNDLVKAIEPSGAIVSDFYRGHFYVSGFIRRADNKCIYFSISDVRHFPADKILIRIATNEHDFSGGANNYATYEGISESISTL
jgi:hypothetical protein